MPRRYPVEFRRKVTVARCTVEVVMRRLGLAGLPGRPRYRKIPNTPTAADLVKRDFARTEPNRLWLTGVEHPLRPIRRRGDVGAAPPPPATGVRADKALLTLDPRHPAP